MSLEVSLNEAIEMYAKASRSWFGDNSVSQARLKSTECTRRGDKDGADIWSKVALEVARLDRIGAPRRRFG